jgi:hypothetical protein
LGFDQNVPQFNKLHLLAHQLSDQSLKLPELDAYGVELPTLL